MRRSSDMNTIADGLKVQSEKNEGLSVTGIRVTRSHPSLTAARVVWMPLFSPFASFRHEMRLKRQVVTGSWMSKYRCWTPCLSFLHTIGVCAMKSE